MSAGRCLALVCCVMFGVSSGFGSDSEGGSPLDDPTAVEPRAEASARVASGSFEAGQGDGAVVTGVLAGGPILHERLSDPVTGKLTDAISCAQDRIREKPSCQGLFARLDADGIATINRTIYYPATDQHERKYCRSGRVFAITTVGGEYVLPCRSYARLSVRQAAIILIHEALHTAGQTEYPSDPDAPGADEITEMVMRGCGLY